MTTMTPRLDSISYHAFPTFLVEVVWERDYDAFVSGIPVSFRTTIAIGQKPEVGQFDTLEDDQVFAFVPTEDELRRIQLHGADGWRILSCEAFSATTVRWKHRSPAADEDFF